MINNKTLPTADIDHFATRFHQVLGFMLCAFTLQACGFTPEETSVALDPKPVADSTQATAQVTPVENAPVKATKKVNAAIDSDNDGILDGGDRCLNTPSGAPVDINGCPLDTDGDSVADYRDQCRGTPRGVEVNTRGCGLDDDHDGVANFRDRCANTPVDISVDGEGCEWDNDGDGVANSKDLCAGTPPGLPVEPMGCVLVQVVTLQGINFQTGSHMLNEGARDILKSVAKTLRRHPKLRVEIGGHTDDTGPVAINRELSEMRAEEAYNYLVQLGIDREIMTYKGYASARPLAGNDSDAGRKQNRRVEMRIVEID